MTNNPNYHRLMVSVGFLFLALFSSLTGIIDANSVPTDAAIELAVAMDPEADPCQDFFQYACGNWIKNNPIPKTKSTWSQFDVLNQQLYETLKEILEDKDAIADSYPLKASRKMYSACMNTGNIEALGLTPLTDYLSLFGGWPMTISNWKESSFDWQEATVSDTTIYSLNLLVNVYNDVDDRNTDFNSIFIDQGSSILARSVLINVADNAEVISAYKTLMIDSAKAVRDWLKTNVTDTQIKAQVDDVLKFESQLAMITVPDESRRNATRMYNPMTLSELQRWTDTVMTTSPQAKINWLDYVGDIYATANITVFDNERVIVVETKYLRALVELLDKTPTRVLANYIHWRMVDELAQYTNQRMQDLQFSFSKVYEGISQQSSSRAGICIDAINGLLGYAVGSEYVKRMFDDQTEAEVRVMVKNLKKSFKSLVDDATWMDSTTKSIAKDKVDAMVEFIGYPHWITNTTALEDYYDELPTISGSHFDNIAMVSVYMNQLDMESLRTKNNRSEWNDAPTQVNAYYSDKTNSITFPAAILQPPYFVKGRSAAINYGAIGSVIGHEITHGFDDEGRQSDKYGNTAQWWTEEILKNYEDRAKCFIDQYSSYTVFNGTRLNGVNTQGENIADNGGLREAFRAYRFYVTEHGVESTKMQNFTPEQMFFLSFANNYCGSNTIEELSKLVESDPHSPYRYRVIGTLSNNEDFVREFKCRPGTPMNRLNKCVLW